MNKNNNNKNGSHEMLKLHHVEPATEEVLDRIITCGEKCIL